MQDVAANVDTFDDGVGRLFLCVPFSLSFDLFLSCNSFSFSLPLHNLISFRSFFCLTNLIYQVILPNHAFDGHGTFFPANSDEMSVCSCTCYR